MFGRLTLPVPAFGMAMWRIFSTKAQ